MPGKRSVNSKNSFKIKVIMKKKTLLTMKYFKTPPPKKNKKITFFSLFCRTSLTDTVSLEGSLTSTLLDFKSG